MLFSSIFLILLFSIVLVFSLDRIVGGKNVKINDFPYHLGVSESDRYICGGVLISPKHALSAAHCFPHPGTYSIRAGSARRDSGGITTKVKTVFLHPQRAAHKYQYDIAILELEKPLQLSDTIQPIQLADTTDLLVPGVRGIVSGFGDIHNGYTLGSNKLRAVEIQIIEPKQCQLDYKKFRVQINRMEFCAGVKNGGRDSCNGDSGGPFVIDGVLYGLVSFGLECGDPEHPGVYTSVATFRDFIRINTGI